MKRFFIIFSIMVVAMLAFFDAKTRMNELEEVAATTPSQIEMKNDLQKSTGDGVQEKTTAPANQMTLPNNQNNNPQMQNIPQKLNPEFRPQQGFEKNQRP